MEKKRLNVNITDETAAHFDRLEEQGINKTEAVRRSVALFAYLEEKSREGCQWEIFDANGNSVRRFHITH